MIFLTATLVTVQHGVASLKLIAANTVKQHSAKLKAVQRRCRSLHLLPAVLTLAPSVATTGSLLQSPVL